MDDDDGDSEEEEREVVDASALREQLQRVARGEEVSMGYPIFACEQYLKSSFRLLRP